MYEEFFGLERAPFALAPDPRFLWLSETHEEGLAALLYGITRRKGFVLLTGEVGTGKTTLLRAALDRLPQDTEVALVMNTTELSPTDLLRLIAAEFKLVATGPAKVDYLIALNRFLLEQLARGSNTVVIIDEAQNLEPRTLEEIRLLSNLETDTEKLLQIVLVGQPELREKLAAVNLRQLRQRIAIEHHIRPLARADVGAYLRHRIEQAGGRYERVFDPKVEPVFYGFSRGCPRLLSLLADRVLLAAFAKQITPVPAELVEEKAKEMVHGMSVAPTTDGELADG